MVPASFTGCYAKTGALRVIDDSVSSCKSSERPLSWSVTGPQGPQGPIGPEGPPGPGSAAFATDGGQDPIALPNATPTTVSGTLSLPQGSYVLSGKVVVYEDDASGGQVTCQLHNAGTGGGPSVLDISDVRLFGGSVSVSEPGSMATLPLVGSITSPEGSAEISIVCTTTGSASHS